LTVLRVLLVLFLGLIIGLIVKSLPDITRYLKIREM
jgi:hypothetical protein